MISDVVHLGYKQCYTSSSHRAYLQAYRRVRLLEGTRLPNSGRLEARMGRASQGAAVVMEADDAVASRHMSLHQIYAYKMHIYIYIFYGFFDMHIYAHVYTYDRLCIRAFFDAEYYIICCACVNRYYTSGYGFTDLIEIRVRAADPLLQGPLHPLEESQRHVLWQVRWRQTTEFDLFGIRNDIKDQFELEFHGFSAILIEFHRNSSNFIVFPPCPSTKTPYLNSLLAVDDHLSPEEPVAAMLRIALRQVEAFYRAGIPLQLVPEDPEIVGDVLHSLEVDLHWLYSMILHINLTYMM